MQEFWSNPYTNDIPIFTLHFFLPDKVLLEFLAIKGDI